MRVIAMLVVLAAASWNLAAQAILTPGLEVDTVIREPSSTEVGPFLVSQTLQGGGKLYSKGSGSKGSGFRARPGKTTRDLCVISNNTGADLIVDLDYSLPSPGALVLVGSRPDGSPPADMQPGMPDPNAEWTIFGYDPAAVSCLNGASVALFLLRAKWGKSFRPRSDYILTFAFTDIVTGQNMSFEAKLTVQHAPDEEEGCSLTPPGRPPTGLLALISGGLAALTRRIRLKRFAS